MTTQQIPRPVRHVSSAAWRSRAASVSATLRRAGYRPLPSGSVREGLLRVRSGYGSIGITVNLDFHPSRVNEQLIAELIELLTGAGYRLESTNRSDEARAVWLHVVRDSWY